jgi:hypothetical protein
VQRFKYPRYNALDVLAGLGCRRRLFLGQHVRPPRRERVAFSEVTHFAREALSPRQHGTLTAKYHQRRILGYVASRVLGRRQRGDVRPADLPWQRSALWRGS